MEVLRPEQEVTSATTTTTIQYLTSVYVLSQVGAVSTSSPPTVIGGPWKTTTSTVYSGQNEESLATPTGTLSFTRDRFQVFATTTPAAMPVAGTQITVTVSSTAGVETTVTGTIPASTTEMVSVSLSGTATHSVAAALAAGTLTVNWTLPTTFPVGFVTVGFGYDDSGRTDEGYVQGQNVVNGGLPPTQATLQMPAQTPGGHAIANGFIEVNITGLNGEAIESRWKFDQP